jgi:SAM-dependent methyltransferase
LRSPLAEDLAINRGRGFTRSDCEIAQQPVGGKAPLSNLPIILGARSAWLTSDLNCKDKQLGEYVNLIERFYPESQFGSFSDVDGTIRFYTRVHALLQPEMTVLDVGCGRGVGSLNDPIVFRRELRTLRGKCRKVIGIDIDKSAEQNPGIDEFRSIAGNHWPVDDKDIDLIISDFVLEHIKEPDSYFAEVARVLKPNGFFCARTSNRIGYVGLLARLLPERTHVQILQFAQKERSEQDIFPTYYRVNTIGKLRRALERAKLKGIVYGYEAEPSYLHFSAPLYFIGKHLHAVMPAFLRTCLFVFARKS